MKLQELRSLHKYKLKNPKISVKGITDDSRKVIPGFIFVAISGLTHDGHDFIKEVVKKGAILVVGQISSKDLHLNKDIEYIEVSDSREMLGKLASDWYDDPSSKLNVIGVTGTKGKTTTSHIIYHILNSSGSKTGLVSSLGAFIGDKKIDTGAHVTNPDVLTLNNLLAEMVRVKCKYAVLEVSSHGIHQKRISGIKFDVAVLTNIAPEHLDYHKNFDEYKKVKMSFVNSANERIISSKSASLNLLPGEFNNINAETALEVCEKLGVDKKSALKALISFKLPEGRLEELKTGKRFRVFIDFAHTPQSLEAVLEYLRSLTSNLLICIFGCASERDEKKRPLMGEISTRLANISIITAEDPRNEDVNKIISEISAGVDLSKAELMSDIKIPLSQNTKNVYYKIPERGKAITFAINKIAHNGDVIVICGKGHEKSMNYNGVEYPWSDKKAVEYALKRKTLVINK